MESAIVGKSDRNYLFDFVDISDMIDFLMHFIILYECQCRLNFSQYALKIFYCRWLLQWICVTMCCLSLKLFLSCKPIVASRSRIISVHDSYELSLE